MIELDISVGDFILSGKFKNKKVQVRTINKNKNGDICINGKPLLRFRILDKQPDTEDKIEESNKGMIKFKDLLK